MSNLLAGLLGVVVGSVTTVFLVLVLLRRLGDRELIERRLRLCLQYRDSLGDLARAFDREGESPQVIEQAWAGIAHFCREFRLTSWVLAPAVREKLTALVDALEDRRAKYETRADAGTGTVVLELREKYHTVDRILRREIARQTREFHAFRVFRIFGRRRNKSVAEETPEETQKASGRPAADDALPADESNTEVPVIAAAPDRVQLS